MLLLFSEKFQLVVFLGNVAESLALEFDALVEETERRVFVVGQRNVVEPFFVQVREVRVHAEVV